MVRTQSSPSGSDRASPPRPGPARLDPLDPLDPMDLAVLVSAAPSPSIHRAPVPTRPVN